MAASSDPKKNYLIAALPEAEAMRWRRHLEAVELPLGQVLYEPGATLSHVYFPTTAIVSLLMTQERIANMLGVRREGVTEAATGLQKLGWIQYQRGHITVLDRKGLESCACECYGVVKKEDDRLLPDKWRSRCSGVPAPALTPCAR